MNYWLMKSEPDVFSIDDLKRVQRQHWDGVRNYQARNFMKNDMKIGDIILFYHSNASPPGVAGLAEVASSAYPDHSSWDKQSEYFDPKSTPENPRWFMVDVQFKSKFNRIITLEELKNNPALQKMRLVQKGNRLSIIPVEKNEFETIINLNP